MATYECQSCGMSVNATCAKCNTLLENDFLSKDDGTKVKIKSPLCCGQDITCST